MIMALSLLSARIDDTSKEKVVKRVKAKKSEQNIDGSEFCTVYKFQRAQFLSIRIALQIPLHLFYKTFNTV